MALTLTKKSFRITLTPPAGRAIALTPPMRIGLSVAKRLTTSITAITTQNETGVLTVNVTAAEPLGIYRAVTSEGLLCQPGVEFLNEYAGVTNASISAGLEGVAIRAGKLEEATWNWTPKAPIFISTNGMLTQVAPALPIRRIGWAVSATQINLDPFPTITGA